MGSDLRRGSCIYWRFESGEVVGSVRLHCPGIHDHNHTSGNCPTDTTAAEEAAAGGHSEVIRFLHGATRVWNGPRYMLVAAANGHLEAVKVLHELGTPLNEEVFNIAVQHGHLHIAKFVKFHTVK